MKPSFAHLDPRRVTCGQFTSYPGDHFGLFIFQATQRTQIRCIVDDGAETGWEHVSVSVLYFNAHNKAVSRMPTWEEMHQVKRRFWADTETVVEFHPASENYVNNHPHCLHLWKQVSVDYALPNHLLVGLTGDKAKDTAAAGELAQTLGS